MSLNRSHALGITRLAEQDERVLEIDFGDFRLLQFQPKRSHDVEGVCFGVAVVEQLEFCNCFLKVIERLVGVIEEKTVRRAEVGESECLSLTILQRVIGGKCLVEI